MFTSEETWQLFESNDCESVSGVGLAIQQDIPPSSGVEGGTSVSSQRC